MKEPNADRAIEDSVDRVADGSVDRAVEANAGREIEVDVDQVIEALADGYRRQLLAELRERNPHGEVPTENLGGGTGEELAIEMVHVHLPRLAENEFIEWDRRSGTVARGPRFQELVPLLDLLVETGSDFSASEH